jgi:hypothetical protein
VAAFAAVFFSAADTAFFLRFGQHLTAGALAAADGLGHIAYLALTGYPLPALTVTAVFICLLVLSILYIHINFRALKYGFKFFIWSMAFAGLFAFLAFNAYKKQDVFSARAAALAAVDIRAAALTQNGPFYFYSSLKAPPAPTPAQASAQAEEQPAAPQL